MGYVKITSATLSLEVKMRLIDNFISYVKIDTKADATSKARPSSKGQAQLAELLLSQLKELGVNDTVTGENGTVYAKIPSSLGCENLPRLGFIAHMDTSDAFSGVVNPQFHEKYSGEVIKFSNGDCLDTAKTKSLKSFIGQTLITTDGSSLLGADDKAGIAEIMELLYIIKEESLPHPSLAIAFTTDEEIGIGADGFDLETFGADYAYTVDGGLVGGIEYETFNAAGATLTVTGVSVHTGEAKGVMVNATGIIAEFISLLPENQRPEVTEGYEGFIHVDSIHGTAALATASMLIRDHNIELFNEKKALLHKLTDDINQKYNNIATIKIEDSYLNMAPVIEDNYHLVENAVKAINVTGLVEHITPIRGGTDGARLSYMGLPCPNLSTGGASFHGPYEHISVEAMQKATQILCEITKIYSTGSQYLTGTK